MRVTEARMMQLAADSFTVARDRLARAQSRLASDQAISRPSEGVAAWAEGQRANLRAQLSDGHETAIGRARDGLVETDRALETLGDALAQSRELAIQGANGALSAEDRGFMSATVRALRDAALSALNTRGPDGAPLLGGSALGTPFDASGNFTGNAAVRVVEIGEGHLQETALSGERLTAAHGVDILPALSALANALDTNDLAGIRGSIGTLDTATSQLSDVRTTLGARLRALDDAEDSRLGLMQSLSEVRERTLGLDPVDGAAELGRAASALEAARASAERIFTLAQNR